MLEISRRGFLLGVLCAPAIVRPGILMPIKSFVAYPRYPFIIRAVFAQNADGHWKPVEQQAIKVW